MDEFNLNVQILKSLTNSGFTQPSPIQKLSIGHIIDGKDVICQAEAGTGKTLCFLIGILQMGFRLYEKQKERQSTQGNSIQDFHIMPYALVIVPTRELAIQIMDILTKLIQKIDADDLLKEHLSPHLFIGGLPIEQNRDVLKTRRCSIIIGTVGRIIQLLSEKTLSLHNIQMIVLDEADKLHENKQFQPHMKSILQNTMGQDNNKPQIACFSATYAEKIMPLLEKSLQNPLRIRAQSEEELSNLEQFEIRLAKDERSNYQIKSDAIIQLMRDLQLKQTIIFYNDKNRGENLFNDLRAEGHKPVFIHGDLTQSDRIKVMHQLKRNTANLIISTDLLSRGIDVNTLDLVLHFDTPSSHDTYLHRIGRTGRYGTYGLSILLLLPEHESFKLKNWDGSDVQLINSKLMNKHQQHQPKQEYFAEFLNGVSDWKKPTYEFYDKAKFKYFPQETDEVQVITKKSLKVSKLESKQSKLSLELEQMLQCEHCREFYKQLEFYKQQ